MALVNHSKKEINAKIVYFGPADSGKSAALRYIFSRIKPSLRGEFKNIPAGGDNLIFFDFSPFEESLDNGYRVRLHVYTLTGQVTNSAIWKMTLKGADGLIIMLDASPERIPGIRESISQLRDFLSAYGVDLREALAVLQFNRSDSEYPIADGKQLSALLDLSDLPCFNSCSDRGEGVLEALTALSRLVLEQVAQNGNKREDNIEEETFEEPVPIDHKVATALPESCSSDEQYLTVLEDSSSVDHFPALSIKCGEPNLEGALLRIPLEIACGGTSRRMIVRVSISQEQDL